MTQLYDALFCQFANMMTLNVDVLVALRICGLGGKRNDRRTILHHVSWRQFVAVAEIAIRNEFHEEIS